MKVIILISILFCLISNHSVAQDKKRFSSVSKQKQKVSKQKVHNNLVYALTLYKDNLAEALTIVEENLLIAIDQNYMLEEAFAYRVLGDFNKSLTNYSLAMSYYEKSYKIYKSKQLINEQVLVLNRLGEVSKHVKVYKQALKYLEKAIALNKTTNSLHFDSYLAIAEVHLLTDNFIKAEMYYKMITEEVKLNRFLKYKVKAILGLGLIAQKRTNYSLAEKKFLMAEKIAKANNFDELANDAYSLLTELYTKQNDINANIQIQEQAYLFNSDRGNSNSIIVNATDLSKAYIEQGRKKEALDLLNTNSLSVEQEENTIEKINYVKMLSDAYTENGLVELAEIEQKKYKSLLDSFNIKASGLKQVQNSKIESLKLSENKLLLMEKDRELNEKQITILKREQAINNTIIQRQLTITYLLLGGLIIIGILTFFLLRSRKQQQKNNKLLILKSLRSQMNPHFIFNSLNSVNSFIAKKDERSANKYLAEFSKLMREVLECSQQDFIPLSKEIHILTLYLNLEHFRFNSHFDYTFTVDPKINIDDYQIPPMLLQPFIENAIWHGLRYKAEKGHLWISINQKSNFIEIEIKDNGIGRSTSKLMKTTNQKKMKSTGIKNIENRLEIIRSVFKKKLEIEISDLSNGFGTQINLKLF